MDDTRDALKDLLEIAEAAIKAGDWKIDGACDPDTAILRARQALAIKQTSEQMLDLMTYGWSFSKDGKRIDPSEVFKE